MWNWSSRPSIFYNINYGSKIITVGNWGAERSSAIQSSPAPLARLERGSWDSGRLLARLCKIKEWRELVAWSKAKKRIEQGPSLGERDDSGHEAHYGRWRNLPCTFSYAPRVNCIVYRLVRCCWGSRVSHIRRQLCRNARVWPECNRRSILPGTGESKSA